MINYAAQPNYAMQATMMPFERIAQNHPAYSMGGGYDLYKPKPILTGPYNFDPIKPILPDYKPIEYKPLNIFEIKTSIF